MAGRIIPRACLNCRPDQPYESVYYECPDCMRLWAEALRPSMQISVRGVQRDLAEFDQPERESQTKD